MGNSKSKQQEDVMVMSGLSQMVKQFIKKNAIIWHDPNSHSFKNTTYIRELQTICDLRTFVDWKKASEYLNKETKLSCCKVITSETNGESFVKEIYHLNFITSIYVYCNTWSINYHKCWAKQYPKIVCVDDNFLHILDKTRKSMIKWQRKEDSLRVDLPNFVPIFNDGDLSDMNYLHLYLKGLIDFTNRQQAKTDFLNLAKAIYGENSDIEKFEKMYIKYDMKAILNWYTKESFLYKLTNNCLRIAKSDSIQYCRLILKDLETAIKEKYQQHSHKFSGLLYRGGYLSSNEWAKLQQNINRDIEILGFLSTTKDKDVAICHCQEDMDKKVLVTIIVPNFPKKEDQSFAEVKEYSEFANEEEVLFNVRSKFTVLGATLEETEGIKIRHLILLYGAQAMKKYITLKNPSIKIRISFTTAVKCMICKQKINIVDETMISVNISSRSHEYLCSNCRQQPHIINKLVLLCLSPSAHNFLSSPTLKKETINMKIKGTIIQYQDKLGSFYGHKCVVCQGRTFNCCYQCLDCKNIKMIYCTTCFRDPKDNSCLKGGHVIILQGYPFCFWSEKMSENEFHNEEYQTERRKTLKKEHPILQQGRIFYATHNYERAIEYFEKHLERNVTCRKNWEAAVSQNNNREDHHRSLDEKLIEYKSKLMIKLKALLGDMRLNVPDCYSFIGEAYKHLEEYQKALEYHFKALELKEAVLGEKESTTALSFRYIGDAYSELGEYQKAIEYHTKALDIRKKLRRNKHSQIADSYSALGCTCSKQGEYRKALEYYLKCLEIHKIVYDDKHHNMAVGYHNLAGVYYDLGEYQKSKEYNLKALEIRKTIFGDRHPDTAESYSAIGSIYYSKKKYQKAIELYSKALEISKTVLGDNHPRTIEYCKRLSLLEKLRNGLPAQDSTGETQKKAPLVKFQSSEDHFSTIFQANQSKRVEPNLHYKRDREAYRYHSKAGSEEKRFLLGDPEEI